MKAEGAPTVIKYIYIDVTCHVTMDTTRAATGVDYHTMRVSGTAVVSCNPKQSIAKLFRIENIGLDSQLNLLFVNQQAALTFLPA